MGASVFYVNSNCGVERIFQQYALRRSLFYLVNYVSPSRHLIRALRAHLPLKGEGIVAGTL